MSVLTLDVGGLDLDVACQRGGFAAPDVIGAVRRSFNGNARSFIRAELMNVPVVLVHLTKEEALTIRQLFAKGAQVVCQGEVFDNALAEITVWGEITGEMIQGGTWWELSVTLHEVSNADTALFDVDEVASAPVLVNWYDTQGTNFTALALSDTDDVTTWPDETANNYDADAGDASFSGVYEENVLNTFPGVRLDTLGSNQRGYDLPNTFTPPEGEAFVVLRCDVAGGGRLWNFGNQTTGPDVPAVAGTMVDNFGSATGHSFAIAIDPTEPFLYHVRSKEGQFKAWVNGTLVYSSSLNVQTWAPAKFGIWLSGGAFAEFFVGWLGELKFYTGWLAPVDAAAEEVALMTKWGIP